MMCTDRFLPTRSCYVCLSSFRAGMWCRLMSRRPVNTKACAHSAYALVRWIARLQRLSLSMTHSFSLQIFEISSRFLIFVLPIGSIEPCWNSIHLSWGQRGWFLSTPWVTHEAYPGCE